MKKIGTSALIVAMLFGLNAVHAGGEVIDLGGLTSKTPEGWKMQKPASKLRKYQFSIPKVDGDDADAELAIFAFGGALEQNIKRWKDQFLAPKGKSIDDVSKLEKFKVGKVADVAYFDVSGTYLFKPVGDPKAKVIAKENYRRFNVILETDKAAFTITLTGPAKTMAKNKDAFDNWLKAFKK